MTRLSPNTFVVGAGPVATALAGALRRGGVPVLGLWARKPPAARAAGAIAGVAAYSAAPPDLLLEAEVVVLAVRDDAIAEVAKMLAGTGLVTRRHVLLHCSGALSADAAFASVEGRIGGRGILHPLRAIPDAKSAMLDMAGTVFGIQGDEAGREAARILCGALKGRALELSGERMAGYHAAAAMASNYVVALLDVAAELLESAGVAQEDAIGALTALAKGAVENVAERGTAGALTGPIRRGDRATVERHLGALASAPEIAEIYRALGRRAVAIARTAGSADPAELDAVAELLADEPASAPARRSGSGR